jgi:hypothetical protein
MSKILEQETPFTDIDVIREALELQGFTPLFNADYALRTMQGFRGTTFKANVGVTSENFTGVTGLHTYGDLGFVRKADGAVGFIGDDILIESRAFRPVYEGIQAAYAERKYVRDMYLEGFIAQPRHVTDSGEVEIVLTRGGTL